MTGPALRHFLYALIVLMEISLSPLMAQEEEAGPAAPASSGSPDAINSETGPDGAFNRTSIVSTGSAETQIKAMSSRIREILKQQGRTGGDWPLAAVPFSNVGPRCLELKLGETVTMMLINALAAEGELKLVDRGSLTDLLNEIELGQTDLVAGNSAASVGNMLGAKILLTGSVMTVGKNKILIVCHIVEVETGTILASVNAPVERGSLISEAARTQPIHKHPVTAGFKSLLIPGWGQIDNDQPVKGYILLTAGAVSTLGGLFNLNEMSSWKQSYRLARNREDAEEARGGYDRSKTYTYAFIGAGAAVLLYSFTDAVIAAAIYNSRLEKGIAAASGTGHMQLATTPEGPGGQISLVLNF